MIKLKIDVTKIDKAKLYVGQKGTYLDAMVFLNDESDQYGNNGMIVQSVTKEEREQGIKGAILGNSSEFVKAQAPQAPAQQAEEDDILPF